MSSHHQRNGSQHVDPEANQPTTQAINPAPKKCSPSLIFILCFALILTVLSSVTLPLLLVSLVILRIFQFIKYGKSYKKLTYFKNFIRGWLYINVMMVLLGLWIFFPIAKYVPSLKQVMVLELALTKWVVIISIVCGFYLISYLIYSLTHGLTLMLNVRSLYCPQAFSEIMDGIIIWWAEHEVMKRVPAFRQHEMLGLPTRRWIRVSILVLIGYNLITLFTYSTVKSLRKICQQQPKVTENGFWHKLIGKHLHKRYVVYFANGMRFSINFTMSSLLLLCTWVSYFGSHLDMNSTKAKNIWEFVGWTLFSLLICSFFWLIKTFVLLAWEIHTVYHRLEPRILPISEQLYFLGILGCQHYDILKLLPKTRVEAHQYPITSSPPVNENCIFKSISICLNPWQNFTNQFASILSIRNWKRITNHLLILKDPTMDDLQRAIKYFKVAKKHLLKETYISDILTTYDPNADYWGSLKKIMINHHEELYAQGKRFMELFNINQTPREEEHRQGVSNPSIQEDSSQICFNDDQKTWVKRAHNQCKLLANTLSRADEVGGCLDKIISWVLIAVTVIIWLLLTGLATTKVLVLIASPLLAATFIFGNSCKTLFEGIIFVYVVHPLDVGDLCVIDDNMLEVISIGIWTTTFTKVDKLGTQEVVIYPNLDLAKKVIINHKTKFDWTDSLVYVLGHLNMTNINNQNDVINFFKKELMEKKFQILSSSQNLTVSVTEDDNSNQSIKLVISLEYKAAEDTTFWTYSECLRRRDEVRADFCLLMHEAITIFKAMHQKV